MKRLKQKTNEQEKQIVDVNLKAAELIEKQTILTQELLEHQKQLQLEKKAKPDTSLDDVIEEITSDIAYGDSEETLKGLKSWIILFVLGEMLMLGMQQDILLWR